MGSGISTNQAPLDDHYDIYMDVNMTLIQRKMATIFSQRDLEGYSLDDFLKDFQQVTPGLNDLAIEQIRIALDHDALEINHEAFDAWLSLNSEQIIQACNEICNESQAYIDQQTKRLQGAHHTPPHGSDVCKRANYLFDKLRLSNLDSARDRAYAAIRELYIQNHDLIQDLGVVHNEVQTKNTLFEQLILKLKVSKTSQSDIYHMINITGHRLIVLGTTMIFDEKIFDLAELYTQIRKLYQLSTPYNSLNREMLIVGLCDRAPAFCKELITMIINSPLKCCDYAFRVLFTNNPLMDYYHHDAIEPPFPSEEETINIISGLMSMSPHQGMSIELALKSPGKNADALRLRQAVASLKEQVWSNSSSTKPSLDCYIDLIRTLSDPSIAIPPQQLSLKESFEAVFIENLISEQVFSHKQTESLAFLQEEFKDELNINPNAAIADGNNMLLLQQYYRTLTAHKQMQLVYELLFPLVCQMGEFYIAALKRPVINSYFWQHSTQKHVISRPSDSSPEAERGCDRTVCNIV